VSGANLGLALLCVLAVAVGQLLFKRVGVVLEAAGTWDNAWVLLLGSMAFGLYGASTLLWIHVLRSVELSRVYPLMALSFVLVPLASALFFGDTLSLPYFAGVLLIVAGVVLITRYG
jgi:drug/metabolite transporter (DMT)-like permease